MLHYNVVPKKNPADKSVKYYAQLEAATPVSLAVITDEIAETSTVAPADVKAVLDSLERRIIAHLQQGHSVRLGDLGSFRPTLKSEGVSERDDFRASCIRKVNVRFTPSVNMKQNFALNNKNISFQHRP